MRKRDGQTIAHGYDALNRETLKDIPGGTAADVYSAWDAAGRKLSARFVSTTGQGVLYAYDAAGRVLSETSFGRAMSFQYDAASNRTRVTWPDAFYAGYVYDAAGRLTAVNENGAVSGAGLLATFGYDNLGRRVSVTRGNTTSSVLAYDNADRLTGLTQNLAGTAQDLSLTWQYRPSSQVWTRSADNAAWRWTNHPAGTENATYDGLNRDAAIAAVLGGYDARGNLTFDGTRTFVYDVENRLTSAGGGTALALTYDPLGRLKQTTAGSAVTQFLYDGDRLSAEYDGAGVLLRRYVHGTGVDEPLVWYEGSGVTDRRWLHADNQGSVLGWSNGAGAAGEIYAYGPYGEPQSWSGSRFRYTGQIMLPEAALYHYKARVYDPADGRFLQTDPVGYKDDMDLYAYVGGDPVNRTDPTGLKCTGKGRNITCRIDQVATPKNRALTKTERAQVKAFNRAYTEAVKALRSNPDKVASVKIGDKTMELKAGDIADTLADRTVVAEVGMPGTAGTSADGTTYVFSQGLAGTVGPIGEHGEIDREITITHEGIHRGPAELRTFPSATDPATNEPSHGQVYDNASRQLLGISNDEP